MKKTIIFLLLISILLPCFKVYASDATLDSNTDVGLIPNARSAVMIDANTGTILYNKNANQITSVASLTKMVSLLIIFDSLKSGKFSLNDTVTVSKNAMDMGGTQLWLSEGDKISVSDLIKGITMVSANELAVSIKQLYF